jgi:hypothetical protein
MSGTFYFLQRRKEGSVYLSQYWLKAEFVVLTVVVVVLLLLMMIMMVSTLPTTEF